MKEYVRENSLFSLCGLNCSLCSMHLNGYCPGCGLKGSHPCKIVHCANEHGGISYCYECEEFPCEMYHDADAFDSFITHKNQFLDIKKAQDIGIITYNEQQKTRRKILEYLLDNCNDGRRKTKYCIACNLLGLADLIGAYETIKTETTETMSVKEKAVVASNILTTIATEKGIELKLRKKPKKQTREKNK